MIKIGIIGSNFGKIGLIPAFSSIAGCKVIATSSGQDWHSMLTNNDLDAIAIAVKPSAQYKIAKFAMKKGIHIFAEKPLASNLKQAKELLAIATKYNITNTLDFTFPEINEWVKVKELLDKERYGKLKNISVSWQWLSGDIKYKKSSWKTSLREGGGVLSFYYSHGFYYLENFAGKIASIETLFTHSKDSKNGAEVGIDMKIKWEKGIKGDVHISCNNRDEVKHQLIFKCEKGTITLENKDAIVNKFRIIVNTKKGNKEIKVKKIKDKKNEDERVKEVRKIATRFIKACNKKKQTYPSFADGVRVQKLIEMARKSKS